MPSATEPADARPPLIAVVGPTAVGKTALAIRLALALDGEIVSADSRQVYQGMDIGTAKPTAAERALAPHHLLDIAPPEQALTLAEFQTLAYAAIADIQRRGRLPLLVGGSGQYVRAVLEGWTVPAVAPDLELRARLEAEANRLGAAALHAQLAALDPAAAAAIDARNVRRVIRALEVCLITGQPISRLQMRQPPPYRIWQMGLTRPTADLYARLDARVDAMLAQGLVAETQRVRQRVLGLGLSADQPALTSLGYREIGQFLAGELSLDAAVVEIKRNTRRFVRQQRNWFRTSDPAIHWVEAEPDPTVRLIAEIRSWLANNQQEDAWLNSR